MGDEELCALVGLDAYLMLRYLRLCMRLTGFSAFWGLAVLYPLYYTGMPAGPTQPTSRPPGSVCSRTRFRSFSAASASSVESRMQ